MTDRTLGAEQVSDSATRSESPFPGANSAVSAESDDTKERFSASFQHVFVGRTNKEMGSLDGATRVLENGSVQIAIHVEARERIQFSVVGLDDVAITRDGESISQLDANPGKYKIVIVGRPKKGT